MELVKDVIPRKCLISTHFYLPIPHSSTVVLRSPILFSVGAGKSSKRFSLSDSVHKASRPCYV